MKKTADLSIQLQLPEILDIQPVVDTQMFHIEAVNLKFSNGATRQFERFVQWPHGVVMIVPMLNNDTILLIREYCAGIHQYNLTLPKGKIDNQETPLIAANRELQEETGYAAKQLIVLRSLTNSPNYSSTRMHVVLAQDLYLSDLPGDEPEPLEILPWPLAKIPELIMRSDFNEGRAIAALYLAQLHLNSITR